MWPSVGFIDLDPATAAASARRSAQVPPSAPGVSTLRSCCTRRLYSEARNASQFPGWGSRSAGRPVQEFISTALRWTSGPRTAHGDRPRHRRARQAFGNVRQRWGSLVAGGERRPLQRGDSVALGELLHDLPAGEELPRPPSSRVQAAFVPRGPTSRSDGIGLRPRAQSSPGPVSRRHAVIRLAQGAPMIEDLGSAVGVRVTAESHSSPSPGWRSDRHRPLPHHLRRRRALREGRVHRAGGHRVTGPGRC